MAKPSELLLSAGWKPVRQNCPPRDTAWIDPVTGKEFEFIMAVLMQLKMEKE